MIDTALTLVLAGLLVLIAGGAGHFVVTRAGVAFGSRPEAAACSVVVGLGLLITSVLGLGLTGLLYRPAVWIMLLAWMLVAVRGLGALRDLVRPLAAVRPEFRSFEFWLVLSAAVAWGFGLIRALAPPFGATDPLAYQLALPRIFLDRHLLSFEPTVTGALYPAAMNLLYVIGLALWDGSLAQVIHWLTGVLCTLMIWVAGDRWFGRSAGTWAAVLFSFAPVVAFFSPQAYIDVGLCYFQCMAFWALAAWAAAPDHRRLALAGLLCGLAMSVKHQGMATAAIGAPVVLVSMWRAQGARPAVRALVWYLGLAVLVVAPWYVRAWYWAGNPVWPLANSWFHGLPFGLSPSVSVDLAESSGAPAVLGGLVPSLAWFQTYAAAMSPWSWTFAPGGLQKDIGVYFVALLPGLLLYLRQRRAAVLLSLCAVYYLIVVRFLHMNPRYGMVLLAGASLLCGLVASRLAVSRHRPLAWVFRVAVGVSIGFNLLLAWVVCEPVVPVVSGREARDSFLQRTVGDYRAMQFVNAHLPADAVVMFQGLVEGFYCQRRYLWGDHPHSGVVHYQEHRTPEELMLRFRQLGITHVVRLLAMPAMRRAMYPDYFNDPAQEAFRRRYLRPLYWDESYVVFQVVYP